MRLLRKIPVACITSDLLAQLRTAMAHEPDAEAFLTHLARINAIALEVARDAELRASFAPDCVAHLSRLPASAPHEDLIARIREMPRRRIRTLADLTAVSATHAPRRRLAPGGWPLPAETSLYLIHRYVSTRSPVHRLPLPYGSRLPRRYGHSYVAPPPRRRAARALLHRCRCPTSGGGIQIRAIRSQTDLAAESDAMHHCAGRAKSYARRVVAGNLYFYLHARA